MYPASFGYSAPATLDEVLSTLSKLGDEGRVLAGGQSLIPLMKLRQAAPAHLVDINGVGGLDQISDSNGHLEIGALVRHADVITSEPVSRSVSTMASAAPWVADPLVRNRGTVVGSVAHCDPKGDWASVMLALDAQVVAKSMAGERTIAMTDFIVDFFTNSLEPGEMATALKVPKDVPNSGGTYLKLERKIGDYATVGVAAFLALDSAGKIARAGLGLTSVASLNVKATEAEAMLTGNEPSDELFAEAAESAARASSPSSDVRGPADYKRELVRVYTRRALTGAWAKARGEV